MKKIFLTCVSILLLALTIVGYAQKTTHKNKVEKKLLQKVDIITGKVNSWIYNDNYIYNGFYLQTDNNLFLVKFPTYMGSQLMEKIKTGNTVSINGVIRKNEVSGNEIKLVSYTDFGNRIYDNRPKRADANLDDGFSWGSGKIREFHVDKFGKSKGLILENNTTLRLSRSSAREFMKLAKIGDEISFTGKLQTLKNGEVSELKHSFIYCQTLTLNGTQYLTP